MIEISRSLIAAAAVGAALVVPPGIARAQYLMVPYAAAYQPEPLYPYVAQPQPYPYAVPGAATPRPSVRHRASTPAPSSAPKVLKRVASKTDPTLIEELRQRAQKNPVIKKEIVVREKPVVIEHQRIVDDPPVVVQREQVIDEYHIKKDRPRGLLRGRQDNAQALPPPEPAPSGGRRVIRAEAEVTILGPDRMNIKLFRKRGEPAPAEEAAAD